MCWGVNWFVNLPRDTRSEIHYSFPCSNINLCWIELLRSSKPWQASSTRWWQPPFEQKNLLKINGVRQEVDDYRIGIASPNPYRQNWSTKETAEFEGDPSSNISSRVQNRWRHKRHPTRDIQTQNGVTSTTTIVRGLNRSVCSNLNLSAKFRHLKDFCLGILSSIRVAFRIQSEKPRSAGRILPTSRNSKLTVE